MNVRIFINAQREDTHSASQSKFRITSSLCVISGPTSYLADRTLSNVRLYPHYSESFPAPIILLLTMDPTPSEIETVAFFSTLISRMLLFFSQGFSSAISPYPAILHRIVRALFPARLTTCILVAYFASLALRMPGTQRMIRIVLLCLRGALPREKGVFEVFWSGGAVVYWGLGVRIAWVWVPEVSIGLVVNVIKSMYWASSWVVPLGIGLWVVGRCWSGFWTAVLRICSEVVGFVFKWVVQSKALPMLDWAIHLDGGSFIREMGVWRRRNASIRKTQDGVGDRNRNLQEKDAYRYKVLGEGEIRLLKLKRAWIMADVECELVPIKLDADIPVYTAVSYAWGPDPSRPRSIVVDGKRLNVTESAFEVVMAMAPESGERFVWVDFICINQEDVYERASQVKLMGAIYSRAEEVKVVLNTVTPVDLDDSDLVVHHLRKTNAQVAYGVWSLEKQVEQFKKAGKKNILPGWAAVSRMFNREYWNRAWVVQEIAMAQKLVVLYGDNELSWSDLSNFSGSFRNPDNGTTLDLLGVLFEGLSIPLAHVMKVNTITEIRDMYLNGGLTIYDIFSSGIQFNATDPRDNIYAFLGLAGASTPLQIEPNYQIHPQELFLSATITFLYTEKPLWFLKYAGRGFGDRTTESRICSLHDSDLPSWVPNWSSQLPRAQLPSLGPMNHDSEHLPKTFHTGNATALEVHATLFDTIVSTTTNPFPQDQDLKSEVQIAPENLHMMLRNGKDFEALLSAFDTLVPDPYPVPSVPRDQLLWRLFLGSSTTSPSTIRHYSHCWNLHLQKASLLSKLLPAIPDSPENARTGPKHLQEALINYITADTDQETLDARVDSMEKLEKMFDNEMYQANTTFVAQIGQHSWGRKVGFTRKGHAILVPPGTQEGDEVYYLAYGETPVVLRGVHGEEWGEEKRFELLGDCYVYGVGIEDVLVDGSQRLRPIAIV